MSTEFHCHRDPVETPSGLGSTEEPKQLPARLPFVLLNGASGIAVGMAVPSHNLREFAAVAVALIRNDKLSDDELFKLPGSSTIH